MSHQQRIDVMKRRLDAIGRHLDDLKIRDPKAYDRIEHLGLSQVERDLNLLESRAGFEVAGSRVPERGAPMIQRFERRP